MTLRFAIAGSATLLLGVAGLFLATRMEQPVRVDRAEGDTVPLPEAASPAAPVRRPGADDPAQLARALERALVARDVRQRETAFAVLLPDLLAAAPSLILPVLERAPPGDARTALRDELARQWVARDLEAASAWMETLDPRERSDTARIAMRAIAASSPPSAIAFAARFGIGYDDGTLEHLLQIWAVEDAVAARAWIDAQPAGEWTDRLRARVPLRPDAQVAVGGV